MKRLITFDMDGVLVDSEIIYSKRNKEFYKAKGFNFPQEVYDIAIGYNARDFHAYMKEIEPNYYETLEDFREAYSEYFGDNLVDYNDIRYPYVEWTLQWLKKHDFKIGLASSSHKASILRSLNELGVIDYFDIIVSGDEFNKSKPDPEIYLHVCSVFECEPHEMIVVEDSSYGIESAHRAGCRIIAKNDPRFNFNQTGAEFTYDNLYEVADIVADIFGLEVD